MWAPRAPGNLGTMNENLSTQTVKQLTRSRSDRMIAGVCGGWGEMLGIDAAVLRIVLVAATLLGAGTGILLYVICWMVMPDEATAPTAGTVNG